MGGKAAIHELLFKLCDLIDLCASLYYRGNRVSVIYLVDKSKVSNTDHFPK